MSWATAMPQIPDSVVGPTKRVALAVIKGTTFAPPLMRETGDLSHRFVRRDAPRHRERDRPARAASAAS